MPAAAISCTPELARRLFITKQCLAAPRTTPESQHLLPVVQALGCLQLDPISAVARSHQLVLFSRTGGYDLAQLDRLLWQEYSLFEYWAHCASIVLTADYPIHNVYMRAYPAGNSAWSKRTRQWIKDNQKLQSYILAHLHTHGPTPSRVLEEDGIAPREWVSRGWTSGRNISSMLNYLWLSGQIMVSRRQGGQKVWDLTERVLPEWAPRHQLTAREMTRRAVEKALCALGAGTARHINDHFVRGRYATLPSVLAALVKAGRIKRLTVAGWPGEWYMHADDEPLLEALRHAPTAPVSRTTLLSPFDNLICDRARTLQMFNFDFRIEIYTPIARRRYGYYVLPILHGDQLIGRIDPVMHRATGQLHINAVYAEPAAPADAGPAVALAITDLATFLGAHSIHYSNKSLPTAWGHALHASL
jgi:uncharacterized protein YcaQ